MPKSTQTATVYQSWTLQSPSRQPSAEKIVFRLISRRKESNISSFVILNDQKFFLATIEILLWTGDSRQEIV